jgi:hypothetical protein
MFVIAENNSDLPQNHFPQFEVPGQLSWITYSFIFVFVGLLIGQYKNKMFRLTATMPNL